MATINIALIGAGLIGPQHALAIQSCPRTRLACIIDPSPSAQATATAYSVPLLPSIAALASFPEDISAAIICTPNSTHVPLAQEILSLRPVPLLIEKPLTTSLPSAIPLLTSPIPILVGHHRRFNPYLTATKTLLASGALGTIIGLSGLWTALKPPSYFATAEWRTRRSAGGGTVAINLVHDVDCLQFLLGPIARVTAERTLGTRPAQEGDEVEEGAAILLRFESGVVGTFLLSDAVEGAHSFESGTGEHPRIPKAGKECYRIFGTKGTVSVPDMKVERYNVAEGAERGWACPVAEENVPVDESLVPFEVQMEHFADVVEGKEKPLCTVEEAMRAVAVCDAVTRSLDTGMPVEIKLSGSS